MSEGGEVRVLGRYAICDAIGSGGMATVHLGRLLGPVGFSRTVAIKRMHPHLVSDPEFVSMFLDEARIAARVQHANVVSTLDVVTEGGELFLVMEYVDGDSLARVLRTLAKKGSRLPLPLVGTIVSQLLYGLHAVHETKGENGKLLGLVHRDVSPDNLLIGRDGTARVLDFGIAKASEHGRRTQAGRVKGKIAYMAPEQLRSADPDRRLDVYAASAVLWECLTGRRLYDGGTDAELVYRVLHNRPEPPSSLVPELSPEVDALVMKGLELEADARYATALEMAVAVERVLGVTSPSAVGRLIEGVLASELQTRADLVANVIRRTAELKSGDIPSAPNLLDASLGAGRTMPSAEPKRAASGAKDARVGTEIMLDTPEQAPALDFPALELPGSGAASTAPTQAEAKPPAIPTLESFGGIQLGDAALAKTEMASEPAAAKPTPARGGASADESPAASGLGGMEVDFGPSVRTPAGGAPIARPTPRPATPPQGQPSAPSAIGGGQVTSDTFVGSPSAASAPQVRVKALVVPLALAGVLVVALAIYFIVGATRSGASASASATAPAMGVDAQRSCEVMRRRARSGASVMGLSRDGWVAELWLRGRDGAKIDPAAIDVTSLRGDDPQSFSQVTSLSATSRATDEGLVVRLWGPAATRAFDADGAARLIKAADLAFDRTKAEAGALYLKCSHLPYHDVGLWFRGKDQPAAATSLLFAMAAFSDTQIIKDGVLEGASAAQRSTVYEQLVERVRQKPFDDLEPQMQRYGGTVTVADGSPRITFSTESDSVRASRIVADHAGVEQL
jgi:serine/threonine-protein kinase